MDITEPKDRTSAAWKNWALMQAGPGGRPLYKVDSETQEVVEADYWGDAWRAVSR